jgi:hypothetical protein
MRYALRSICRMRYGRYIKITSKIGMKGFVFFGGF